MAWAMRMMAIKSHLKRHKVVGMIRMRMKAKCLMTMNCPTKIKTNCPMNLNLPVSWSLLPCPHVPPPLFFAHIRTFISSICPVWSSQV